MDGYVQRYEYRVSVLLSLISYSHPGHDLRRTLLCYGMIACQTASGVWFLIAYTTYFFTIAGITKAFQYSILQTCVGFIGVNIGMFAMKTLVGRRAILMIGATACGLCMLVSAVVSTVNRTSEQTGKVLVAFMALFMFFYNGCVGGVSYPVATELVSSRLRAWTVGTATSLGYVLAWLTGFCTPYFINPTDLNWVSKHLPLLNKPADQLLGRKVLLHLGGFELPLRRLFLFLHARNEGSVSGRVGRDFRSGRARSQISSVPVPHSGGSEARTQCAWAGVSETRSDCHRTSGEGGLEFSIPVKCECTGTPRILEWGVVAMT
jgi:hypothetical protein